MPDRKTFESLLKLSAPWFIESIEMDVSGEEMHLRIAHHADARFVCPSCGRASETYDHAAQRTWRHLDMWQCRIFLHCGLPRVRCAEHGVLQVKPTWAQGSSRLSLAMERRVLDTLLACQNVKAACGLLRLKWDQVEQVKQRAVARGLARREARAMPYLAVDEKAIARGHRYASVLYDLEQSCVLEVALDRKKTSLRALYNGLTPDQIDAIKAVCMDMHEPFIVATAETLPNGADKIVHDRFHVMLHASEALNKVRAQEARALAERNDGRLKGSRQLWLYSAENLPDKHAERFAQLQHADLKTAKAWAMKENLRQTWLKESAAAARDHLQRGYDWVCAEALSPMRNLALMVKEKMEPIVRYCEHRISNGKAEGINSKLMAIQRQARGLRSFASFRTNALFHCGKLDLYPLAT